MQGYYKVSLNTEILQKPWKLIKVISFHSTFAANCLTDLTNWLRHEMLIFNSLRQYA